MLTLAYLNPILLYPNPSPPTVIPQPDVFAFSEPWLLSAVTAQFKFEEEQIAEDKMMEEERIKSEARKLAGVKDEPDVVEGGGEHEEKMDVNDDVQEQEQEETNDQTGEVMAGDDISSTAASASASAGIKEEPHEGSSGGQGMETTVDGQQQEVKIEGTNEDNLDTSSS